MNATAGTMIARKPHQTLGFLALTGGLAYVIAGIVMAATDDIGHPVANVLSIGWALGVLCGLVGIGLLGAAGRGLFGKTALGLPVLAYAVLALDLLLILAGVHTVDESPLFALGLLGTLVGMLLLGIATVAVRRWAGWRRFAPFALLVALPLDILLAVALDQQSALPPVGLAWMLIGYAVLSTPDAD